MMWWCCRESHLSREQTWEAYQEACEEAWKEGKATGEGLEQVLMCRRGNVTEVSIDGVVVEVELTEKPAQ